MASKGSVLFVCMLASFSLVIFSQTLQSHLGPASAIRTTPVPLIGRVLSSSSGSFTSNHDMFHVHGGQYEIHLCFKQQKIYLHFEKENQGLERESLAVKSTNYSSRRPGFGS